MTNYLASSGFLPRTIPVDHWPYYYKRGFPVPDKIRADLTRPDQEFLEDYGYYIESILDGVINPANQVQEAFTAGKGPMKLAAHRLWTIWNKITRLTEGLPEESSHHEAPIRAPQRWAGHREPKTYLRWGPKPF